MLGSPVLNTAVPDLPICNECATDSALRHPFMVTTEIDKGHRPIRYFLILAERERKYLGRHPTTCQD